MALKTLAERRQEVAAGKNKEAKTTATSDTYTGLAGNWAWLACEKLASASKTHVTRDPRYAAIGRIERSLDAGKITREQADGLLAKIVDGHMSLTELVITLGL